MTDKKKVTTKSLLKESLRLRRQISTKKYFELFREMHSICHKKDLLNEAIKNFNEKEGHGICQWKLDTLLNNLDSKCRVGICFG